MLSWRHRNEALGEKSLDTESLGKDFALLKSRKEMLRLQFAKIANYYPDLMAPEWGGDFYPTGNYQYLLTGFERFCQDIDVDDSSKPMWLKRKDELLAWGPGNAELSSVPDPGLGQPFEAYLSVNGSILRLAEASKLLLLTQEHLFDLKLELIVDSAVVAAAIMHAIDTRYLQHRL